MMNMFDVHSEKKPSALAKVGERMRVRVRANTFVSIDARERNTHLQYAKATAFNTPEEK